jgi:hypothetical protein
MIIGLLPIVLDKDRAPHLESFLEFLSQSNHSRITLDQWDSFLQFNHNVKYDLSNLEEDGACKGHFAFFLFLLFLLFVRVCYS